MKNLFFILLILQFGCEMGISNPKGFENQSPVHTGEERVATGTPIRSIEEAELCDRLSEMQLMPFDKNTLTGDPIYDGLISRGRNSVPCLIKEITNNAVMKDPREAPHILDFRVGDAAVFMLHRITDVPIKDVLQKQFAKEWEARGIYAYFAYAEVPEHRKRIQQWWEKWAKNNLEGTEKVVSD